MRVVRMQLPGGAAVVDNGGDLRAEVARLRQQLADQPFDAAFDAPVDPIDALRTFVRHHVACVYADTTLLKSLQAELCPARTPWLPPRDAEAAHLVNALVLADESAALPHRRGAHGSAFEWFVDAMDELGGDRSTVDHWLGEIRDGMPPTTAMTLAGVPAPAVEVVRQTLATLQEPLAVRAAVLAHTLDVLPQPAFAAALDRLRERGVACAVLAAYARRRTGPERGELAAGAHALADRLCGTDERLRQRGLAFAVAALRARLDLCTAIRAQLGA